MLRSRPPALQRFSAACLFALLLAPVGCGGGSHKDKIWIVHFPDYYTSQLKRVAVLPFADRSRTGAGARISDRVSSQLTNNGTFEVYTRQNLSDILAEKDLLDAGIIEGDAAIEIGRVKAVQALICGVVNRAEAGTRREIRQRQVPIMGHDVNGNPVITGFRNVPYEWFRHDAAVECNVVVVDTTTGRQIAAFSDPTTTYAEGSPPRIDPPQLLRACEENQVERIVFALAVTRTQIKLKGDVLKTLTGLYDGKWESKSKFTPEDAKVVVVVTLPPEADRNNFQVTIVKEKAREPIAEKSFVWTKQNGSLGHEFAMKQLLDAGGFGKYEAKFFSGQELIAKRPFSIVESKK